MKLKPVRQQVMISAEMSNWFDILENKYRIKRTHFIREAIIEKFKRDTPKIKSEYKREREQLPF